MVARTAKFATALILVGLVGYWGWARGPALVESALAAPRPAQTPARPAPAKTANGIHPGGPLPKGSWAEPAGDLANTRYSGLDQITAQNVKNLKVVAEFSTGTRYGLEGQPVVVHNSMYVVTPFPNDVLAFNLKDMTGPMEWEFSPHVDSIAQSRACCGPVNRGAAYGDGKIVYQTLDGYTVAINAETGKLAWRTRTGDLRLGETASGAPLIVDDKVYVGDSGADFGVRGKLTCLNLPDGHILWTAYSAGPDSDDLIGSQFKPFYPGDQGKDLGAKTWDMDRWQRGGGTVPGWISYDAKSNRNYYSSGNPGVWNPYLRPGSNKWSDTNFARNADSGQAEWAFQIEPHDNYGYNEGVGNILVNMNWDGRPRELLLHPSRNGFMLVLDRTSGQLLSATKFVDSTNWASGYDLKTGQPILNPDEETHQGKVVTGICPSTTGATGLSPSAVSPHTGYLYIPVRYTCMDFEGRAANYIAGTPFIGAMVKMYPGPGGFQGELLAWNIQDAKPAWAIQDKRFPITSGVLATAGNVVFYGTMEGWFRAVDARTGKILWQFKTASGIVGDPITFQGPDGKQYVAVYSGIGGWMGKVADPMISTSDPYGDLGATGAMAPIKKYSRPGDVLYIFGF